ncbi:MAG TPA: peptide chain release factor N(5)-glutamine methyltransferase [Candidatus Moranbacteria bacterium]|nr:MAG: Release factor glutamine methyltransferase [Candidatus Moranbacteria bacterium GW2011_GWF1_34_10]HBI17414.1 peptide chain release factor N(5)-glutamine methyltransferase [Candidatus Moranbacteria bacterium]
MTIENIKKKYFKKLDSMDLDLLIAHVIKKEREFILAHPEYILNKNQELRIKNYVQRRLKNEPVAYILGEKEFYGLNFKVNRHTLIPRPETELMVELAMQKVISHQSSVINVVDIGTGSGNIVVSLAHSMEQEKFPISNLQSPNKSQKQNLKQKNKENELLSVNCGLETVNYFAIDISKEALKIAKQNAKLNKVSKNIKFLRGNLLDPFLNNLQATSYKLQTTSLLILANLPYLSKEIYNACALNVKKYEPKTALYSANQGLSHYEKLFSQIKNIPKATNYKLQATVLIEISPEQKKLILPVIKKYFPKAKIEFKKDLAQKWRVCKVNIH